MKNNRFDGIASGALRLDDPSASVERTEEASGDSPVDAPMFTETEQAQIDAQHKALEQWLHQHHGNFGGVQ